jgi:hypothetical protein
MGATSINHHINRHWESAGNLHCLLKLFYHAKEFINTCARPIGYQLEYDMDLPMHLCTEEVCINSCALDYFSQCSNAVIDGIKCHQSCKFEGEFKAMATEALEKIEEQEKHHLWHVWWNHFVQETEGKKKRTMANYPYPKAARGHKAANQTHIIKYSMRI